MQNEIWEDIKNYKNRYKVSNMGRVKTLSYKGKGMEKILSPISGVGGYLFVGLYTDKKTVAQYRIHRLVAETFINNKENKPCVNHINSDRTDNSVINLEWCTPKENVSHCIKKGRWPHAREKHPSAKLTEVDIEKIRSMPYEKGLYSKIARDLNVSKSTVNRIYNHVTWK